MNRKLLVFLLPFLPPFIFIGLLTLWMPQSNDWQHVWIERWPLLAGAVLLTFIWATKWRSCIYPTLASYILLNSLVSAYYPPFHEVNSMLIQAFQLSSMDGLLFLTIFLIFLHIRPKPQWLTALQASAFIVVLGIAYAALKGHAGLEVPLLHNPSMAATFVALLAIGGSFSTQALAALAIFLTGRHIAALCLAAGMAWRWLGAWALLLLLPAGQFVYEHQIPDNGRFPLWRELWQFFRSLDFFHQAVGLGFGTTRVWSPVLTIAKGFKDGDLLFFWAHNDFLQLVLELGFVGGVLVLVAACKLFIDASRKDQAVMVGFMVAMGGNFPLHSPLHLFFGWVIAKPYLLRSKK